METMASAVEKEYEKINTFAVAKAGNSCFSDTTEVMSMLCYITNKYGKLERNGNNTWRRVNGNPEFFSNNLRFRSRYLTELEQSLQNFNEEWKKLDENNELEDSSKIELLEFYERISKKGKFNRKGKGSEWFMEKWNQID